jgi:hypothetical protein
MINGLQQMDTGIQDVFRHLAAKATRTDAMLVSGKGTLLQYAGRLHREHVGNIGTSSQVDQALNFT